jgi:hypothetical protein
MDVDDFGYVAIVGARHARPLADPLACPLVNSDILAPEICAGEL